jgi:hypothetical protein
MSVRLLAHAGVYLMVVRETREWRNQREYAPIAD